MSTDQILPACFIAVALSFSSVLLVSAHENAAAVTSQVETVAILPPSQPSGRFGRGQLTGSLSSEP